jgi:hypothetical protein
MSLTIAPHGGVTALAKRFALIPNFAIHQQARALAAEREWLAGAEQAPLQEHSIGEPFGLAKLCLALDRARLERHGDRLPRARETSLPLLLLRLPRLPSLR